MMTLKKLPMEILIFLLTSCFLVTVACAGDLYDSYTNDYDKFWDKWNSISKKVKSCEDIKYVSQFLKDAILLSDRDELVQVNANTIEYLAANNTQCLLKSLNELNDKELKKVMSIYVANPYGLAIHEIESLLSSYWKDPKYSRIKEFFYSQKEW
jgi:hypothetical protein